MKNSQQGMFTVEASIIFPVIFITILSILWMGMAHTQNIMAASAAMRAANRAASYWEYTGGSNPTVFQTVDSAENLVNANSFSNHDPYRYLFEGLETGQRVANTETYVKKLTGDMPKLVEEEKSLPRVEKTGGLLKKYVQVTVEKEYINPLAGIMKNMGFQDVDMNQEVVVRVPLNNPGEFVRNVSIIYDLYKGILLD
ncbi:MAG: pilus assembly protein [bacterium]|nr:pilus assembly protein [bacterium]